MTKRIYYCTDDASGGVRIEVTASSGHEALAEDIAGRIRSQAWLPEDDAARVEGMINFGKEGRE